MDKRWKFRDFYFNKCLRKHGMVKYFHREPVMPRFAQKPVMFMAKTNAYLYDMIQSGKPFLACRVGNTELQTVVGNLKVKTLGHSKEADEYLDRWFTRLGKDSVFFG